MLTVTHPDPYTYMYIDPTLTTGQVVVNASVSWDRLQNNFMSIASSPYGPWSTPVPLDPTFNEAVAPFVSNGVPNRNSNLIITIAKDDLALP